MRAGPLAFDVPLRNAILAPSAAVVLAVDLLVGLPLWSAIIVLIAALLWRARHGGSALLLASGLSVELLTALAKFVVDRPRPLTTSAGDLLTTASFPSGHVARAVVALGLFALVLGRHRPSLQAPFLALASAFLVALAIARIASGEHWPSDVLGGLLLGAIWLRVIVFAHAVVEGRGAAGT